MASYRELLRDTKQRITEIQPEDAEARLGQATFVDVREQDEHDQGTIPGSVFIPRGHLESQAETKLARPRPAHRPLLRRRQPLRVRGRDAPAARLHRRRLDGRRVRALEERGPPLDHPPDPHRRAARPLRPPHPASRGRRGRPAEAAREPGAAARRGRPRLARRALPRGGGRRHARHRRHGRRRRVEPAAPDPPQHGPHRRAQGRLGEEDPHRSSTPTSTSSPTTSASAPTTCSTSSTATT